MFGAFRFGLALLVVAGHLRQPIWLGAWAVFAFYTISGYLMCLVLNERYGFSRKGFGAYALNRFLRIHPPYWLAGAATLGVMLAAGEAATRDFWGPWELPTSAAEWARNLGIFGLQPGPNPRLIPAAWALSVELTFYLAIGLLLGRGRRIAIGWLLASIGWHLYLGWEGANWVQRYFPVQAASLPFSLGAVIYHHRSWLADRLGARWLPLGIALAAWGANYALVPGSALEAPRFYANCLLSAAVVALLTTPPPALERFRRVDTWLGDLSYPIYLIHFLVGFVVEITWLGSGVRGPKLFWWSLPWVIVAAWGMHVALDTTLERWRGRVKRRVQHDDEAR